MLMRTIEPKSLYNCVMQKSGATTEFRFLPRKKIRGKNPGQKKHALEPHNDFECFLSDFSKKTRIQATKGQLNMLTKIIFIRKVSLRDTKTICMFFDTTHTFFLERLAVKFVYILLLNKTFHVNSPPPFSGKFFDSRKRSLGLTWIFFCPEFFSGAKTEIQLLHRTIY